MNKTADPALSRENPSCLAAWSWDIGFSLPPDSAVTGLQLANSPGRSRDLSASTVEEAEPLISISFSMWTHPLVSVSLENLTSTDAVPCRDKRATGGEETDNTPRCSPWTHTPVFTGSDLLSIRVLGCPPRARHAQELHHPG